jgi:hypothetical protein
MIGMAQGRVARFTSVRRPYMERRPFVRERVIQRDPIAPWAAAAKVRPAASLPKDALLVLCVRFRLALACPSVRPAMNYRLLRDS